MAITDNITNAINNTQNVAGNPTSNAAYNNTASRFGNPAGLDLAAMILASSGNGDNGVIQAAINSLVQNALDTGDWSRLKDYKPTKAQLDKALSSSSYKNNKGLTDAQRQQLALAYKGKFNKYTGNDSTDIDETWSTANAEQRGDSEAAKMLAATGNAEEQINLYKSLLESYGNLPDSYQRPEYTEVNPAMLRDLTTLQQQLGTNINYDYDSIKSIYDNAARQGYDIEQQSGATKSYYQHLADAQNSALDTIRQQYGQAVAQGASKGMMAAQQLSSILGTSAIANEEATQLAIDKQTRANTYAQQVAENAKSALQYSNQQQMDMASLSRQLYNDDIQRLTAQLSYNQGINTDYANYNTGRQSALSSLQASLANTTAGIYNNNQSAIAQLQSAIESANATKYAADKK